MDDLYLYLIFGGFVLLTFIIAIWREAKKESDNILSLDPWAVLAKVLVFLGMFYGLYFFVVYSVDVIAREPFFVSQLFDYREFDWTTYRGLLTNFCLTFTLLSLLMIVPGLVPKSKDVRDFVMTLLVWHLVVTCAASGLFPRSGGWWTFNMLSFLFFFFLGEYLSAKFSLMPYKSSLVNLKKETERQRLKQEKKQQAQFSPLHQNEHVPLSNEETDTDRDCLQISDSDVIVEMATQSNRVHPGHAWTPRSIENTAEGLEYPA
eukprot:gnl/Hemi2/1853_TR655_c0_g1_i1.p1 gnl/Hemi2/1853_TR655_c0_g1~~gnl/Hemi2/1853_TR655_c0_g1_i1.p1  ORF type:complete len:262 (+),score=54.39 gnl/Hemi2/1853_TR655_c0_g1_i1:189-974(+)